MNRTLSFLAAALAGALCVAQAQAAQMLRVGKAVPEAFSFAPLDIGRRKGGRFNPSGLAVLAKSFVELHTLPAEPDMSRLYTEAFLPAATH